MIIRVVLAIAAFFFCLSGEASAQCTSSSFRSGYLCGNPTGSTATPRPANPLSFANGVAGTSVLSNAGVLCNGSHDDTVGIQAVLNSGARRVHIPPGLTCKASSLTIPDNTTLSLSGSVLKTTGAGTYIVSLGNNSALIGESGAAIDNDNSSFAASNAIHCDTKTGATISGLTIKNSLNYGIVADDCSNILIDKVTAINVAYNMVFVRMLSQSIENINITNNRCYIIDSAPIGAGCAYIQAPASPGTLTATNLVFSDNICTAANITVHAAACVTVFSNTGRVAGTFVNPIIQGNLSKNLGWGVSGGGFQNGLVSNNVTQGASDICVELGQSIKSSVVDNTCEMNGVSIGLSVQHNSAMVYANNIIKGTQQTAILETFSGGTNVISGNNISVTAGTGIASDGPSNTITGNMLNGNFAGINGILADGVGGVDQVITGNSTIAWTGTPIVVAATAIVCANTTLGCPIGTVTSVSGVTYPAGYTSGGIPYAAGVNTIQSSALLAANQIMLGGGAGLPPATLGSLGLTTTVLHGNAGGAPTFGAVALAADVSGRLPFANLTQGTARSVLGVTGNATADFASIQGTASQFLGVNSAGTALAFQNAAALTKVDDTNVTLTLGGTPATALMTAASITAGWTGTLAASRGGTGVANSSTITVGGTFATAGAASLPTIAQGDLWYGSAAGVISSLAKNTSSTRYLSNTGTTNNPAWAQIDLTNGVTGVLPSANGGTGVNNGSSTITIGGNVTYSGAFPTTMTVTNTTNSTFPAGTHTLAGLDVAQTWSALQGFNSGDFKLNGATSGSITINAAATAGSNTLTLPAGTTDFSATGGTSQVVKQTSSGGALTVARLACSDLSDGATGCSTAHTEGTWTPTLVGTSTPGTGQTYLTQVGSYETNGRQVTARFTLNLSGLGTAAGNARIGGLPLTSTSTSNDQGTCVMGYYSVSGLTASTSGITGVVPTSGTVADLYSSGGAGASAVTITQVGASALLIGVCHYRT